MEINKVLKSGIKISEEFSAHFKEEKDEHFKVKLAMVERYTYTLKNIDILMSINGAEPCLDYSLCLVIRAGLLDTHTIHYFTSLILTLEKDKPKARKLIDEEIQKMYINQLQVFFRDTDRLFLRVPEMKSIKQKQLNDIVEKYRFCFNEKIENKSNPVTSLKTFKNFKTAYEMYEVIVSTFPGGGLPYDFYSIFSKIEHFGVMTPPMISGIGASGMISQSITVIMVGLQYLMMLIDDRKPQLEQLRKINDIIVPLYIQGKKMESE